ncbi:MAG: twin-arginine translocation pathway signal [Cyanobacteriota bacterium]|nr:twin-arginine translocation pathway signal [Cyanobacteriota bacterium]
MAEGRLTRRSLLGFGVCGSLALLESSLAGCARVGPRLASRRGDLPERWVRTLPRDWQPRWMEGPAEVLAACREPVGERPALVQLSDGWASGLPRQAWAPWGAMGIHNRLDASAGSASRLFASVAQPTLAFPWSRNPWVLVLRNRPDLLKHGSEGWDLLLDPSLEGKVVLPSSPRVVMELVGGDSQRLCRLRRQALALDDRHGIQLLLNGPAEAAVLPRPQVVPLLRRDPRLTAHLPPQGAPMAWSMLLRPAGGAGIAPLEEWLAAILQPPLLPQVLAAGWVPPLPRPSLEAALRGFPPSMARLLLPPESTLRRCKELPPLEPQQKRHLQELWDRSTPCQRS